MKKPEIAKEMARQSGGSRGEAADRLDRLVLDILDGLRQGKATRLPGLGYFRPGTGGRPAFQREGAKRRG
jgi:nucleoid DNA-binding protein